MINLRQTIKGFETAEARWARLGPYYAMFPLDFAFEVVTEYSNKGDFIIDPFAGRGSSIYAGGVLGRQSLGIEINPVGWLYSSVKLRPAKKGDVLNRLEEIYSKRNYYKRLAKKMPKFFQICYCEEVLKFLLSARKFLSWKTDTVDATLMSILLVYLHGKLGEGLSNQMRMTKAMGINYSLNWWKKNNMTIPPRIEPLDFIKKKIEWRYKRGTPNLSTSYMVFGDSTIMLKDIVTRALENKIKFSLLFTSPPYHSVTDYHIDQWLRLWLLGGGERPKSSQEKNRGRFISKDDYYNLLDCVFGDCAAIMAEESTVYVRTDAREFCFSTTRDVLRKHFPDHKMMVKLKPFTSRTQTEICGNTTNSTGEIDIILRQKK